MAIKCPECDRACANQQSLQTHYGAAHSPPYPWETKSDYENPGVWKRQRKRALERDGYTCQHCGSSDDDRNSPALEVHHKDHTQSNHSLNNLVTLCSRCHKATTARTYAIIDMLHEGRCSPAYIAEKHDYSRQNVTNRLRRLVEHGYVEKLHPGLYELVEDPRQQGES